MNEQQPIGGPLVLRHARKRRGLARGQDDYDVMSGERVIGRIFRRSVGVPPERPWMWCISGVIVSSNHGFAATLDEAKAAFAATWRAWLARTDRTRPRKATGHPG